MAYNKSPCSTSDRTVIEGDAETDIKRLYILRDQNGQIKRITIKSEGLSDNEIKEELGKLF